MAEPRARVGVDMVPIPRMARALARTPRLKERLFTEEERAYCDARSRPAEHYAARFAAREAVLKALGCGFSQGIGLKDVWVRLDKAGEPHAELEGRAREVADSLGIQEVALSLSHTQETALANAVAVTPGARPKREEEVDARQELQASFKEARSIIDELERVQIREVRDPEAPASETIEGEAPTGAGE